MKTKMTLFSAAKQGFAVCDCEVEVKGEEVRVLSAVDRSTKKPLDCESVMKWHCNEDLRSQLRSQTPPPSQLTERSAPKCAVPDDCPKAFARFYQDEETPVLPNLGWD